MVITSSAFKKAMLNDMYGYMWDNEQYDTTPEPYKDLFIEKKISDGFWRTTSLVGMGKIPVMNESQGYDEASVSEGYTVYGKPIYFGEVVPFTYGAVEDNNKIDDILKDVAANWGGSLKTTRNDFYVTWFLNGAITTGSEYFNGTPDSGSETDDSGNGCYDGTAASIVPNFVASGGNAHVSKAGTSYYNHVALDLDNDNLETLYNLMAVTNARDENDNFVPNIPDTMIVSRSLAFSARRILESTQVSGNNNNDKNVLQNIMSLVVWDQFTDTDAFVICQKKKGLYRLIRQEPKIRIFEGELGRRLYVAIEYREGGMLTNWRKMAASNLATS